MNDDRLGDAVRVAQLREMLGELRAIVESGHLPPHLQGVLEEVDRRLVGAEALADVAVRVVFKTVIADDAVDALQTYRGPP